jgi:hypothetical protein
MDHLTQRNPSQEIKFAIFHLDEKASGRRKRKTVFLNENTNRIGKTCEKKKKKEKNLEAEKLVTNCLISPSYISN